MEHESCCDGDALQWRTMWDSRALWASILDAMHHACPDVIMPCLQVDLRSDYERREDGDTAIMRSASSLRTVSKGNLMPVRAALKAPCPQSLSMTSEAGPHQNAQHN